MAGHLILLKNDDVPGVIGHVGGVLGENKINIANFSLGRQEGSTSPGAPLAAIAVVEVDSQVPEAVLMQLKKNPAIKVARAVSISV